jgi:eukaryotic-like serine/threonine-protein kinase
MSPIYNGLGKYQIIKKLGRGGMADVYLARDTVKNRQVALKLIEHGPDLDAQDVLEAERRGALLQAQLAAIDSRVVAVHETSELDGHFYVDMEYVEGDDLSEVLRRGRLHLSRVVKIANEVCDMLARVHAFNAVIDGKEFRGVIHGDIKPKNIRINSLNQVKVLDFGIAKALSRTRKLTRNEFGSVAYASPERLESGEVDAQSDLWSVGVLLYEMVTGIQPFRAETTGKLEQMIRARVPPAPLPDDCPEPLKRIILKMLAPDINRRYQSASQIKADLEAFRDGRRTAADAEFDSEATRRTRPVQPVDVTQDRTRRTTAPPSKLRLADSALKRKTLRRTVQAVLITFLTLLVANEVMVWSAAQQLERKLASEQTMNMKEAWNQYQRLLARSYLPQGLGSVRKPLKQKFIEAADRVIADYRGDTPRVAERDWEAARTYLAWALELDPGDKTVRAYKRYCEGHVDRINGEVRKQRKRLNDAILKFKEAADLKPKWPDPHLGLARVYIYDMNDLERGSDALKEAEEAGYSPGKREKAQMADGYRNRADRVWGESVRLRGFPQEKEHLLKAREDYQNALEIYQSIVPFANTGGSIRQTQKNLERVEERLKELEEG